MLDEERVRYRWRVLFTATAFTCAVFLLFAAILWLGYWIQHGGNY